jgi:hypothetical protein
VIPCERVPKPAGFREKAEIPGERWLQRCPDNVRPRDFWSPFRPALADGFRDLCAYSAIFDANGTVDHFVSLSEDRSKAYDWDNYRYCSEWINKSKGSLHSSQLLDPFEVCAGWFEILLPSLQLRVSEEVPPAIRARAECLIERLHLRDDERALRTRRSWLTLYEDGELTLGGLRKRAPLIAEAVERRSKG